jgi:hypothetical protein
LLASYIWTLYACIVGYGDGFKSPHNVALKHVPSLTKCRKLLWYHLNSRGLIFAHLTQMAFSRGHKFAQLYCSDRIINYVLHIRQGLISRTPPSAKYAKIKPTRNIMIPQYPVKKQEAVLCTEHHISNNCFNFFQTRLLDNRM